MEWCHFSARFLNDGEDGGAMLWGTAQSSYCVCYNSYIILALASWLKALIWWRRKNKEHQGDLAKLKSCFIVQAIDVFYRSAVWLLGVSRGDWMTTVRLYSTLISIGKWSAHWSDLYSIYHPSTLFFLPAHVRPLSTPCSLNMFVAKQAVIPKSLGGVCHVIIYSQTTKKLWPLLL